MPMQITTFLTATGKAIFLNLVVGAIIWFVFLLLRAVFSKKPGILFSIAFAAQSVLLAVFIVCLYFFTWKSYQAENLFVINLFAATKPWNEWLLQATSVLYVGMLIYFLLQFVIRYRNTGFLLQQREKIPVAWKLFTEQHRALLGIKKEVKIFLTKSVGTPLTMGWLQPVILIPVVVLAQLSATQLEAVIIHELAHIKRRDYLLHLVAGAADIMLCFNPFSRFLLKAMDTEREKACDDYVLQFKYAPVSYAEALLSFAVLSNKSAFAAAAKGKTSQQLLFRIQRMLKPNSAQYSYAFSRSAVTQFCLALLVPLYVLCIQWIPRQNKTVSIVAQPVKYTHSSTGEINKVSVKNQHNSLRQTVDKPTQDIKYAKQITFTPTKAKAGKPGKFSDIVSAQEHAYREALQKSMELSALEVETLLQQSESKMATEPANVSQAVGVVNAANAEYAVYNAGTEQYVITPDMFDALVDAWNNRKALTMPLANGDSIESVNFDEGASTTTKWVMHVVTKDTSCKEHHFTLEINIYQ